MSGRDDRMSLDSLFLGLGPTFNRISLKERIFAFDNSERLCIGVILG